MRFPSRSLKLVKPVSSDVQPVRVVPDLASFEFVYFQNAEKVVDVPPSPHIRWIRGAIERVRFREVVGRFELAYLDAALAAREGISLDSLAAMASADMVDICSALRGRIQSTNPLPNILVVHRIEVLPSNRGAELGLAITGQLIRRHAAGCSSAAIKVCPGQYLDKFCMRTKDDYEKRMMYDTFEWGIEIGIRKLKEHLAKLGFRDAGADNVLMMDLT
jgi:hypothetical protein